MRIFAYLRIGFLIVWLLAPTPLAVADTAIQAVAPDGMPAHPQPSALSHAIANIPALVRRLSQSGGADEAPNQPGVKAAIAG